MRVRELSRQLLEQLRPVCLSDAQCQAERDWLLQSALECSRETLLLAPDTLVSPVSLEKMDRLLEQRITQRLPLQYVLGEAYFGGLRFFVTPDVLIPRPETELLVDAASAFLSTRPEATRVLDLGCGSGCIPITLKKRHPHVEVTTVDISAAALAVARQNAALHDVELTFIESDWFETIPEQKRYDGITSNPPYIPLTEKTMLQPEVQKEPEQALFVDAQPAHLYRMLIETGLSYLAPGGAMFFELGDTAAQSIAAVLDASPVFQDSKKAIRYRLENDYAGWPRCLIIETAT